MQKSTLIKILIAIAALLALGLIASQNLQGNEDGMIGVRAHFAKQENQAVSQPYQGVQTSKGKQENLFKIEKTGVSTSNMVLAAQGLLNSLSNTQREKVSFAIDSDQWRRWSNVDNGIYIRQGVSLQQMSDLQQQKLFALLDASLSVKGMEQVRNIIKSEHTLKELNDLSPYLDEKLYFITVMGEPSLTQPWGWQFEGHHLVINYFVLGDQVVMTPLFMGAEPVVAASGKYQGNVVLQQEQDLGLALMQQLSSEQQQKAIITDKRKTNTKATANKDNLVLDYEGLNAANMTSEQKTQLLELIKEYVDNINPNHADVKMRQVREHLDNTYFAWAGTTDNKAVFYYRIHSPVILIEFDHQAPIATEGPDEATRNHIHTMVRTPNGNDYGKDLLKQHWQKHHH